MAEFKVDECGTCHAPVIFAVTHRARLMPVDATPVKGGNVQLEDRGAGTTPLARVLNPTQLFGKPDLRHSRFVTCPDAAKWRHRSTGRRP